MEDTNGAFAFMTEAHHAPDVMTTKETGTSSHNEERT
jgi:hypothetical protein